MEFLVRMSCNLKLKRQKGELFLDTLIRSHRNATRPWITRLGSPGCLYNSIVNDGSSSGWTVILDAYAARGYFIACLLMWSSTLSAAIQRQVLLLAWCCRGAVIEEPVRQALSNMTHYSTYKITTLFISYWLSFNYFSFIFHKTWRFLSWTIRGKSGEFSEVFTIVLHGKCKQEI